MPFVERQIASLAARQHGVISHKQLAALGLDDDAIRYRLKIGRLHRLHRGVYAVGHRPPSPHARAMAAVLACGADAVLSHRWAAWLWGIARIWLGDVEITAPGEHNHRGINAHRSRTLARADRTTNFGIPVTSLARTVLDLTDVLDDKQLARAVNEARLKGLRPHQLAELLATPGRATTRLAPFVDQEQPTRSEFEDAFLAFAERHGLPRPLPNETVAGYLVDMLWPDRKLIVELDSRTHHDHVVAFEADRERDATTLAAGYRTVRVTWARMTRQAAREAERLGALLA